MDWIKGFICGAVFTAFLFLVPHKGNADDSIFTGVGNGQVYVEYRRQLDDNVNWHIGAAKTPRIGIGMNGSLGSWTFGLGSIYGAKDDVVGTNWKYELRVEYSINKTWEVGLVHESNCRTVCGGTLKFLPHGASDIVNDGYNFIGIRRNF